MNIETVERDESNEVSCPVCGKVIITENEGNASNLCEHVEFIFLQSINEFEMCSDEIEKNAEKIKDALIESGNWDDAKEFLPDDLTILDFTEDGMCCGPCSFTVYIGINSKKIKKAKKKAKK